LYPISDALRAQLEPMTRLIAAAPLWQAILVMALAPAICEELAFRGFILSGLRRLGGNWPAIALSSALFGLAHGVIQQSASAALLGLVLGYVVVRGGSLWPAIALHFAHNSLTVMLARGELWIPEALRHMTPLGSADHAYHWTIVVSGALAGWLILRMLRPAAGVAQDQEPAEAAVASP
jgi:sodium transport system permease protein